MWWYAICLHLVDGINILNHHLPSSGFHTFGLTLGRGSDHQFARFDAFYSTGKGLTTYFVTTSGLKQEWGIYDRNGESSRASLLESRAELEPESSPKHRIELASSCNVTLEDRVKLPN